MSWFGTALDDIGHFFESVGQKIAPRDSYIGKVERAAFNTVTAPVQFTVDVAQGKNVASSLANRTIQQVSGLSSAITAPVTQSAAFRSVTKAASPYTLGLTDRVQEIEDYGYKAGQMRHDESLTSSEQFAYFRDGAEIAATAFGVANAGAVFSAAKSVGAVATPVLLAQKLASGKGNLADVAALTGADTSGLDGLSSYWNAAKDGYNDAGAAQPASYADVGYSGPGPTNPPPAAKNNAALIGVGIALVTVAGLAFALSSKRRRA
jgi:hypothetical protein